MIKLHGFGPNLGLPDASPFVLKIDAYLRLAEIPFESVSGMDNVRKAPKGKLPFITDGDQVISDSVFIVQYLQNKYGVNLDAGLTKEQQAVAFLVCSTLEEKSYWCGLYYRWIDDTGWRQTRSAFFGEMPAIMKLFVPVLVRRDLGKALVGQGTGRHSPDEILQIARDSISSVATLLGSGPFLFGEKPCGADATLYGSLAQLTLAEIDTPINAIAAEYPNLKSYCERFRQRYYSV